MWTLFFYVESRCLCLFPDESQQMKKSWQELDNKKEDCVILGGSVIQERTRSAKNKLERHSQFVIVRSLLHTEFKNGEDILLFCKPQQLKVVCWSALRPNFFFKFRSFWTVSLQFVLGRPSPLLNPRTSQYNAVFFLVVQFLP